MCSWQLRPSRQCHTKRRPEKDQKEACICVSDFKCSSNSELVGTPAVDRHLVVVAIHSLRKTSLERSSTCLTVAIHEPSSGVKMPIVRNYQGRGVEVNTKYCTSHLHTSLYRRHPRSSVRTSGHLCNFRRRPDRVASLCGACRMDKRSCPSDGFCHQWNADIRMQIFAVRHWSCRKA